MYNIYYTDSYGINILRDNSNNEIIFNDINQAYQVIKSLKYNTDIKTISLIEKETGAILLDIQ